METADVQELRNVSDSQKIATIMKMDLIDDAGVNLQCVNSSDFIVGKQTNFNGPVTIINYEEGTEMPWKRSTNSEEVVIKERILAPSLAASMENFVKEKAVKEIPQTKILGKKHEESFVKRFWKMKYLKLPIFVWSFILLLVVCSCVVLIVALVEAESYYPSDVEKLPGHKENHTLFRRTHWKAAPEQSSVVMRLPVPYVLVSSSGGKSCSTLRECKKILRDMQALETKKTKSDIYANFLVSSDGSIFEGRGWEKRNAYEGFANNRNIEIQCIGDFAVYGHPTEAQLDAIVAIVEDGVLHGKVSKEHILIPANATGVELRGDTPIIGKNLYEAIKCLPNFEPIPYSSIFSTKEGLI